MPIILDIKSATDSALEQASKLKMKICLCGKLADLLDNDLNQRINKYKDDIIINDDFIGDDQQRCLINAKKKGAITPTSIFLSKFPALNAYVSSVIGIDTEIAPDTISLPTGINEWAPNSFVFENNIPYFLDNDLTKMQLSCKQKPWKVTPRTIYEHMLISAIMNKDINIVTCSSRAGLGKTFLSLACAFQMVFGEGQFEQILIVKSTHEIGQSIGFLPGDMSMKTEPHFDYLSTLITKLRMYKRDINDEQIITKPINYLRGHDIADSVMIIDEAQNLSRVEIRSVLTRASAGTKAIVLGDVDQIDNPALTRYDNGLAWTIRKMYGSKGFSHLTLKGNKSRGPVCDMVNECGL